MGVNLQPYAEYKEHDVDWLGKLPMHWSIASISTLSTKITNGYVGPTRELFKESGVRYLQSLHVKRNKINFHTPYYVSQDWSMEKAKSILREGDVLVVQTGDIGQVAAVTKEFEDCNCHALIIIATTTDLNGFYLSWLLNSDYGFHSLKSIQTGALHPHLNCDLVKTIKTPIPTRVEQETIVSFLDHETTKIDALIEKQQQLIKLLKEKRQAVISHAVTKGLNPNAPMRDSGVEWLGEVPEHWVVARVKNVVTRIVDGPHFSPSYVDEGYMFISARNIKVDRWSLDDAKYVSERDFFEFNKRVVPGKGDVLLTKGGTTGIARAVDLDFPFQVWVHVAVLKTVKSAIDPFYFAYVLNGTSCYEQSQLSTYGATNNDLGLSRIANIYFALPGLNEQITIRESLDSSCEKIDKLISKAELAISLMHERRTALISAAVTGKIDVRNWQPPAKQPTNDINDPLSESA